VALLGGFRVERTDLPEPVSDWQRRTAKTLTKLLATCPEHALHREQILDLLWPGVDSESALNSFRKALHAARRAFEPELVPRQSSAYLRLTDSMLALDANYVEVDADDFEQRAETALRLREIGAYEAALAAYHGELLPEDRYEDWCADRRSVLAELRARLLLALAEALEERGAYNESADRLRELLQQDATREEVHRRLIRLYAEMGTPDQSVRQFHLCEEALRRELDLTPQHETVSLYNDVLANRIPERSSTAARDRGLAELPRPPVQETRPPVEAIRPPVAKSMLGRPFVGREQVLDRLCEQLSQGDQAAAGMILLSGEAGIGKTRLLEELATKSAQEGAAVLWGGSGAHGSDFAYGPFAVALEGYVATRPEPERAELAQLYPELARLVPSLADTGELPRRAADPHHDDRDLTSAIVRLMTDLGRRRRVLFVLGDLHGTDSFSLGLIRYLSQLAIRRPWLLIATVREEELDAGTEIAQLIDATSREGLCLKVELQCLSRPDCDELVRAILRGSRPRDELLQQIYSRSRGNPLFVEELVRELRQHAMEVLANGSQHQSSWAPTKVPTRVRSLATMRLSCLDETLRRVLGLAAAASATEISLNELRAGAAALEPPIADAALFDALDRALHTHLLEERGNGYAFRHPLLRSALYQDLPRHRRAQLHAALRNHIGRAPEERWNQGPSSSGGAMVCASQSS
jgi:DNA-binding SARP family transcriptional activator